METNSLTKAKLAIPEQIVATHYCESLPDGFLENPEAMVLCSNQNQPSLYSAKLPKVLNWLQSSERPLPLEKEVCEVPVLLYDKYFATEKLLFHYDGTPASALLIKKFIHLFQNLIKGSKATIISPSFIPKAKIQEEQELIKLINEATSETSFIKFNFTRIGDFWSYAVKNEFNILITSKYYQNDLAKVLFHFYKGGMWYDRLAFYLSL
jgi:hypothetical protein